MGLKETRVILLYELDIYNNNLDIYFENGCCRNYIHTADTHYRYKLHDKRNNQVLDYYGLFLVMFSVI